MRRRVVITGFGAVSPYGEGMGALMRGLRKNIRALSSIPEELKIRNIDCHVAGLVPELKSRLPRGIRRSMSPMSIYAYCASLEALSQAGLEGESNVGVSVASTLGSAVAISEIFDELHQHGDLDQIRSMAFFKIMNHTVASNLSVSLKLNGRTISPSAACATGIQAIGLAYEMIAYGREARMLAGGSEEYSFLASATFDKLGVACSAEKPAFASIPFDVRRAGVVCGEGAGILVLENLDSARSRGARILGEIAGFATLASDNLAILNADSVEKSMRMAMLDAGITANQVEYVNAHATGTKLGDVAEARAIGRLFGDSTPVGSLKGHLGHTLAASGALELAACVAMMQDGELIGALDDFSPDPECERVRFARTGESLPTGYILKNSFGLGGIYSSLILAPWVIGN